MAVMSPIVCRHQEFSHDICMIGICPHWYHTTVNKTPNLRPRNHTDSCCRHLAYTRPNQFIWLNPQDSEHKKLSQADGQSKKQSCLRWLQCTHLLSALKAWAAREWHRTEQLITTWASDVLLNIIHGCLYNQALLDVWSTGTRIKCLYST